MGHLAVDLGANGGKLYVGAIESDGLSIREVARFDNRPVERDGRYVWDTPGLCEEIEAGLEAAAADREITTVGVDTWGVDFGLLREGEPVAAPYAYRDPDVGSTIDEITAVVDRRELFERTGINHWNIPNTLWQYHYVATERPSLLAEADRLVMMPQFVGSLLGGRACGEPTIASTSQMLDPRTREWDRDLLSRLDLPTDLLPDLEPPGTTVGTVEAVEADLVLPASHDTASAVAGLPLGDEGRAFLSTGTWFIVGIELDAPILTREAFELGASNELGADGTVRFVSNVNGFFLLEECREAWREGDAVPDYETLLAAAADATVPSLVDPDDPLFGIEGAMPDRIRRYCRETDQPVPSTRGEIVWCILRSLAAKTAVTLEDLSTAAGESVERLHVGGGGVRNELFCELLASAVERPVRAGPADATAVGNVLLQAVAGGDVDDLDAGRELVAEAYPPDRYTPGEGGPDGAESTRARIRDLEARTVGEPPSES